MFGCRASDKRMTILWPPGCQDYAPLSVRHPVRSLDLLVAWSGNASPSGAVIAPGSGGNSRSCLLPSGARISAFSETAASAPRSAAGASRSVRKPSGDTRRLMPDSRGHLFEGQGHRTRSAAIVSLNCSPLPCRPEFHYIIHTVWLGPPGN